MKLVRFYLVALLTIALNAGVNANNILVQNVTSLNDNPSAQTIEIQFDLSWENSWRDSLNWDAAWIWVKFQDANGDWQHAKINTAGFSNGTGTSNTITVPSDQLGAFVHRTNLGTGNFNSTNMQLQWNYGLSGVANVTGLEIRVYAVEMVYIPQGPFNVAKRFYSYNSSIYNSESNYNDIAGFFFAPGDNFPVIDTRMSPNIVSQSRNDVGNTPRNAIERDTFRIKGDAGIDADADGIIDHPNYPTGYQAFYCYKYELSEQQYADFLNTLDSTQIVNLGIAGENITFVNGQYFSSTPTRACGNSNQQRTLAYADWSGVRPMTHLELNKASYGPKQPVELDRVNYANYYENAGFNYVVQYPAWGSSWPGGTFNLINAIPRWSGAPENHHFTYPLVDVSYFSGANTTREQAGASYYGVLGLTGNAHEPVVKNNHFQFSGNNGDGAIDANGDANAATWDANKIMFVDMIFSTFASTNSRQYSGINSIKQGFRYVRTAP